MLAALAVAGSLVTKRDRAARPGHDAHRHADLRRPPHRRDPARRAPHLRPRPPARPRRAGPHDPALLDHAQGPHLLRRGRRRAHRDLRPRLSPRHHRRQPGRVPRPRRRQPGQAGRQGRRLATARAGLQRRPLAVPDPPVADRRQPGRDRVLEPRAEQQGPPRQHRQVHAGRTCASNAPYNPGLTRAEIPPDAVQTSASGVDPQISVANARIQAGRVAARTGIPKARVLALVKDNTDDRALGLFGEPGVNVLDLNLAIQEARR